MKVAPKDPYWTEHYTKSCCAFDKDVHVAMSYWHQGVEDGTTKLAHDAGYLSSGNPCSVCPDYTCRIGNYCAKPEYFLADGFRAEHSKCSLVFGDPWPASSDAPIAEDIEVRGCDPSACSPEDAYATPYYTKSCYVVGVAVHKAMRFWHQGVDDGTVKLEHDDSYISHSGVGVGQAFVVTAKSMSGPRTNLQGKPSSCWYRADQWQLVLMSPAGTARTRHFRENDIHRIFKRPARYVVGDRASSLVQHTRTWYQCSEAGRGVGAGT